MKYFIFTISGLGLPIAYRLQQEGHDVVVGVVDSLQDTLTSIQQSERELQRRKERRLSLYDGLLKKLPANELTTQLKSLKSETDCFVFFDDNLLFKYAEQIEKLGLPGNYPTEEDALLEIDRGRANKFVQKHYSQLAVAESKEFNDIKSAIQFLESDTNFWVLKGKADHARTIVPETNDAQLANQHLIEALRNNAKSYESPGFILELFISNIIELTPEKIYYDGKPIATTLDIENKPIGSGNIGTQTGCSADLVFATDLDEKINQIAFPPIVDEMAKAHRGLFIWDASLLIDSKSGKIYFGEYCANRPGYNALFTEISLAGSASRYFENIRKHKSPFPNGKVGASVRLFNLNQDPSTELTEAGKQLSLLGDDQKNIWLWDVKEHDDKLISVGYDRNLAVVTGVGESIEEAVQQAYKNTSKIAFEGVYYRPSFDFISRDYPTSILNRLNYGLQKNLYRISFPT